MSALSVWLAANRSSPRLAFLIRTSTMILSSALALLWARLLLRAMGQELYGLFLTFQAVSQLGALGDFGVGAGVGVTLARLLHAREEEKCREFMASARGVFLAIATVTLLVTCALAPFLPGWLHLRETATSGSLEILFIFAAVGAGFGFFATFFDNLNYVSGNLVWPLLPAFLVGQLALGLQVVFATTGSPLWLQYAPQAFSTAALACLGWFYVRVSHPFLWWLRPVTFHLGEIKKLVSISAWAYLGSVSNYIYLTCDRLIINAYFGADSVPGFRFNNRLSELIATVIGSAAFFAIPGIVRRCLSPEEEAQRLGREAVVHLQRIQTFASCLGGLGYLLLNGLFIQLWVGSEFVGSWSLQAIFALNLATTLAGTVAVTLLGYLSPQGVRLGTTMIGVGAILNLSVSILAARQHSIVGIAAATLVSQLFVSSTMAVLTARRLGRSPWRWLWETVAVPCAACALGAWLSTFWGRGYLPAESARVGVFVVILAGCAALIGLTPAMIRAELQKLRLLLPGQSAPPPVA